MISIKDILLIVGNFNDSSTEINLSLDIKKFGLEGKKLTATNELTKQNIFVSETGLVKAKIKPKTFMLIKIECMAN